MASQNRGKRRIKLRITTVLAGVVAALAVVGVATADTVGPIDFEAPTYSIGSINGQDGWSSTGAAGSGCAVYDHTVASNTYGYSAFGAQSLRISNAVTSGCFGDQTFSKSLANEAGETSAENGGLSGGTRQTSFTAQWSFASTVPGAEQPGLSVVASPDRGDGARMSWVQMTDTPGGLDVNFFEYTGGGFVQSSVATGLSRTVPHTIGISMLFVDGPANDVVKVYVDGVLGKTGTSWEDYFREQELNPTRTVDSILFRTGGTAAPATLGNGFVIDNLTLTSSDTTTGCLFSTSGTTMTLLADCTTDQTILVPNGFTLDGDGHSITAVDPFGAHFLGAVIKNGGMTANVTDVTVTASALADVCDGGNDRLRGILLDGASGSVTNTTVTGIRQATTSGCQEGNAIEARNAPFVAPYGPRVAVTITGNTVSGYQKTGILTNGSVTATVKSNTVTGDGPVGYIAQNGVQVGFGATATVESNTISGNSYTGPDVACGLLLFEAQGVRQSKNGFFGNERDLCNFGRGGGKVTPTP